VEYRKSSLNIPMADMHTKRIIGHWPYDDVILYEQYGIIYICDYMEDIWKGAKVRMTTL
jgi:hypothetical protein